MPPVNLLIKPVSGMCNLHCQYCFYKDLSEKRTVANYGRMSLETLEKVMEKTFRYAEQECTIAYQGGEPTLAGLDFFRESISLQNKYNKKGIPVHNALQTNGYQLSREWAEFLAENHFLVGVSLDGIWQTHDALRLDSKGKDTFSQVMKTLHMFQEYGVDFNILTVVNAYTAKHILEIYRFYKAKNFQYVQFIPCLDPLGEEPGKRPYSLTPEVYGDFLCKLFDVWYEDFIGGHPMHIQQFENYIEMLMGYAPSSCGISGICSYQHVVEANGDVYPCDFYVTDPYCLGNLVSCDFEQLQAKRNEIGFIQESMQLEEECRTCPYVRLCRGGCKRNREPRYEGKLGKNYFCCAYKRFFSYAGSRLKALAGYFIKVQNERYPQA